MPNTVVIDYPFLHERMKSMVGNLFDRLGGDMTTLAREVVPVDTGALRASITHEVVEGGSRGGLPSLLFGATMPYTVYVELGTSRMRAQPFIVPSAMLVAGRFGR